MGIDMNIFCIMELLNDSFIPQQYYNWKWRH
jgi:hypothetical protein